MKKFFSLLALVGVLAACQKEDLKTAFKVDPGVATVHATAVSIDGTDITSNVTFSYNGIAGGTSQTFESTMYEAFDQEVIVSAVWTGYDKIRNFSADQKVRVHVLPGGKADYNVTLILGELNDGEFTYSISGPETLESGFLFNCLTETHSHAAGHAAPVVYSHDGKEYDGYYFMNPTEFVLRGVVNYTKKEGVELVSDIVWTNTDPLQNFIEFKEAWMEDGVVETPDSFNITVSAFAMYCAYHAIGYSLNKIDYVRINNLGHDEVVGSFTYKSYDSNEAGYYEAACEGHEAHYVPGHGHEDPSHSHGHGTSNAGGGIVYAD